VRVGCAPTRVRMLEPPPMPSSSEPWTRGRPGVLLAAALAVVAVAYSNSLAGPFVWDDRMLILENPRVREMRSPWVHLNGVFWSRNPSLEADPVYYRPVTTQSFSLDWALGGGEPVAFHLTNLVAHLLVCVLVFVVARRLGAPCEAAALAAGLFGTFPRLTESVTWISGRTDVLAAMMGLAALALHAGGPPRLGRRALAAVLLLGALLAKEVGAAAVAAVVVLEALRARDSGAAWKRLARHLAPVGIVLVVYAGLRLHALHEVPRQPAAALDAVHRAAAPVQTLGAYLLMLVDPLRPRLQIGLLRMIDPKLLVAGGVAIGGIGWSARRAVRAGWRVEVLAPLTLAAVALALVLHVAPLSVLVIAADRFLYLVIAGLAIAGAIGAASLSPRAARVAAGVSLAALPAFAASTFVRNLDWADEVRLWEVAVATSPPENALPRVLLGGVLLRNGRFREVVAMQRDALAHADAEQRAAILINVAGALSELGEYDEAHEVATEVVRNEPNLPVNRYNLGLIEARRLRFDEAEAQLARALELLPDYGDAQSALETIRAVRRELSALPAEASPEATALRVRRAALWNRLGRTQEAADLYREAIDGADATADDVRVAAGFLLTKGSVADGEMAVRRLQEAGIVDPQAAADVLAELARRNAARAPVR
jgi:protein O-mannosyl-transferase